MITFLKIVHFLAFAAGTGSVLASILIARTAGSAPPDIASAYRQVIGRIGLIGVVGIVLLWITGPLLLLAIYGSLVPDLSHWFWAKMLAVVVVTVLIVTVRVTGRSAQRGNAPLLLPYLPRLAQAIAAFVMLAIIFAILAFGG